MKTYQGLSYKAVDLEPKWFSRILGRKFTLETNMSDNSTKTTHFGFKTVNTEEKEKLVGAVFHSVASKYDVMNDLMSLGIHRLWKDTAITNCAVTEGQYVLDLAGGTGDLTSILQQQVGETGTVVLSDINLSMLSCGRDKLINNGKVKSIEYVLANGESLPFASDIFDCVIIGFGLRNITNQENCLKEIYRVLKVGGRIVILEFSKPTNNLISKVYDLYSFNILPKIGKIVANDENSYQYLAESIRKHPDQETLLNMLNKIGYEHTSYINLSFGICAIHKGFKC